MTDDLIFRKSIPLPRSDKTIDVRGLSLDDISVLLHANMTTIVKAVEQYKAIMQGGYAARGMDEFMLTVASEFPLLAAEVIALAADRPADADLMRKLPAGVSLGCLLAVAELTLEDMGALTDPSPALASLVRRALARAETAAPLTTSPTSTGR